MSVVDVIRSIETRLVDFVFLGDSNTLFGGTGWDHGWQKALLAQAPMYATGLISAGENGGNGANAGYGYVSLSTTTDSLTYSLPASHSNYFSTGIADALYPHEAIYHASGDFTLTNKGLSVDSSVCGIDPTKELYYEIDLARFSGIGGVVKPSIERDTGTLITGTTFDSSYTADDFTTLRVTAAADAARTAWDLTCRVNGTGQTSTGPFATLYQSLIQSDVTAGFRFTTIDYRSGKTMVDLASDLQNCHIDTLSYLFGRFRARQLEINQQPRVVFIINSGTNDRSETRVSVGPSAITGDSPEAYIDNWNALRNRLRYVWVINGWSLSELYILACCTHPIAEPDNIELLGYRNALREWVKNKADVDFLDYTHLTSYTAANALSYYDGGGPTHLTQAGYEGFSALAVTDIFDTSESTETALEFVVSRPVTFGDGAAVYATFDQWTAAGNFKIEADVIFPEVDDWSTAWYLTDGTGTPKAKWEVSGTARLKSQYGGFDQQKLNGAISPDQYLPMDGRVQRCEVSGAGGINVDRIHDNTLTGYFSKAAILNLYLTDLDTPSNSRVYKFDQPHGVDDFYSLTGMSGNLVTLSNYTLTQCTAEAVGDGSYIFTANDGTDDRANWNFSAVIGADYLIEITASAVDEVKGQIIRTFAGLTPSITGSNYITSADPNAPQTFTYVLEATATTGTLRVFAGNSLSNSDPGDKVRVHSVSARRVYGRGLWAGRSADDVKTLTQKRNGDFVDMSVPKTYELSDYLQELSGYVDATSQRQLIGSLIGSLIPSLIGSIVS